VKATYNIDLMNEAKKRAQRARQYADKFPHLSSRDDPWCSTQWQYKKLERLNERRPSAAAT
jgi:hypothetical protein